MLTKNQRSGLFMHFRQWMDIVLTNRYFLFISLLILLKPFNVTLWPVIDLMFKVGKLLVTGIFGIGFLFHLRRPHFFLLNLLFVFICFIATVVSRGQFIDIQSWLSILLLALMFHLAARKKFLPRFLQYTSWIFAAWIILNTLTVLLNGPLFAKSPYNYITFFLGSDNYFCFILVVMIGVVTFAEHFRYGRLTKTGWALWGMVVFSEIYRRTFGGLVGLLAMIILIWVARHLPNKKFVRVFNPGTALAVNLLILISVAYLHVQNLFTPLLLRMGKGTTFSYRDIIWPRAMNLFLKKPILGYGIQPAAFYKTAFVGADHCHNLVMQLLVTGGLIGTAMFSFYLFTCFRSLCRCRSEIRPAAALLAVTIFAFFITSIFDFYITLIYLYLLLDLTYYAETLARQASKNGFAEADLYPWQRLPPIRKASRTIDHLAAQVRLGAARVVRRK